MNKLCASAVFVVMTAITFVTAEPAQTENTGPKLRFNVRLIGGVSISRIEADSQMQNFFAPTSKIEMVTSPSIGPQFELTIGRFAAIELGLRYARKGQNTGKTTVTYSDDLFPHDFESNAELTYVEVPILAKPGLFEKHYWLCARLGISPALLWDQNVSWIIDGNAAAPGSDRMPNVSIRDTDCGVILGGEAGVRFGSIGIFLMAEWDKGFYKIADGLPGFAGNESFVVALGVGKSF